MTLGRDSNDLPRVAAQAAWVRRLAVALAHDVHAGEDIAQDALLAASRGHGIADLRAWLAGTVRNLARLRLRSDDRRAARELRGARAESVDDPALAFERLELQEALLGAVRQLAEPYRTTVLLRWFEGLEPEQIAERTKTPVRTVHTRLHRALGLLRETLDRRSQGDRSRWLAAWLPALTKSTSGWKWLLLMELKTKLALAGLAAVALTTFWVVSNPAPLPEGSSTLALAQEPGTEVSTGVSTPLEATAPQVERREAASEPGSRSSTAAALGLRRHIHGLVIDVTGKQIPRVELAFRSGEDARTDPAPTGTSDLAGRFELEADATQGTIEPVSSQWVVVYRPEVRVPDPSEDYVLVLGRPRLIHGVVRENSGTPIAGAEVWLSYIVPDSGERSLWHARGPSKPSSRQGSPMFDFLGGDPLMRSLKVDLGLTRLQDQGWSTRSAANGSYSIQGIDSLPNARICASAPAYEDGESELREGESNVVVVLHKRSDVRPGQVYGKIVDPQGKLVSRARLRFGTQQADSDDLGEFVIGVDGQRPGTQLIAFHRDWRPVLQPCLSNSPSERGAWPDPLVLRFTQPQTGISGAVVDLAGKRVPDVDVLTLDPLSWNGMFEALGESPIRDGDGTDRVLGDELVTTDSNGRFSIAAVAGRSTRLLVRDRKTLEVAVSEPIPAGTAEARIVFGREGRRCRFAGRLVDLHGNPIADGRIAPMRTVAGSGPRAEVRVDSDGVPTDAEGRFEILDKSCGLEAFIVWPDPGAPAKIVPIGSGADREALLIRVGRIARVQVEIRTSGLKADSLTFLDVSGTKLGVGIKLKGGWTGGESWSIGEGRTDTLIVSEEAKTLVLWLRGEEVARVAIDLDPARVTLVQP